MSESTMLRLDPGITIMRHNHSKSSSSAASAHIATRVNPAVRTALSALIDLPTFRETASALSRTDRLSITEQALVLFEQNYVHLPLKEAMHAVDPMQKLKLLEHQLRHATEAELESDLEFHRELTQIFMSVRDLHTNYILPAPFNRMRALLPFLIESFQEDGQAHYLVTRVTEGFESPPFEAGVEVLTWNGIPIDRAVELNGERFAGSNPEANRARGLATLTVRVLALALPPEEDRVIIGYRTGDGEAHEIRVPWLVFSPDADDATAVADADFESAAAVGIDLELDQVNRVKTILFAPDAVASEKKLTRKQAGIAAAAADLGDLVASIGDRWPLCGYRSRNIWLYSSSPLFVQR